MSQEKQPFRPERIDEQIEDLSRPEASNSASSADAHLISQLRQIYAEDSEITAKVWKQLAAEQARRRLAGLRGSDIQDPSDLQREREVIQEGQLMQYTSNNKSRRHATSRLFQLAAAILLIAVLIGGMDLLLSVRNHLQIGSQPTPVANGSHPTPDVTPTPISCDGQPHGVTLPEFNAVANQDVFYVTGKGGYQALPSQTALIRYNLATGKHTTLVAPNSNSALLDVKLSPDKQWLLYSVYFQEGNKTRTALHLMSIDGGMDQVLYQYCSSSAVGTNTLAWSPDQSKIAFSLPQIGIDILTLSSGKLQTFLEDGTSSSYRVNFWIDNQQLLVQRSDDTGSKVLLLDTNQPAQTGSNLKTITSLDDFCGNIAPMAASGSDSDKLLVSSCTGSNGNCQAAQVQGPSTINVIPASGGSNSPLYESQSYAITAISPADKSSFLIYIENTTGDLSQDGLWRINFDGSGQTRLTTNSVLPCEYGLYAYPMTQIASGTASNYALLASDGGVQKLQTGSLNGSENKTIATGNQQDGTSILILIGLS